MRIDGYDAQQLENMFSQDSRAYPNSRTHDKDEIDAVHELMQMGIDIVSKEALDEYIEALRILRSGDFLDYCAAIVNTYHAGDLKLTRLMLRSALRPQFSSNSALLHIATTGHAGAGKNDLIENVTAVLPEGAVVPYGTITSKNLFYELEERVNGKKVVNPYHFNKKIVSITEIADSTGFSGLKAFAELNERTNATHKATRTLALQVKGTRAMWIASVTGVQSSQEDQDQVNRRFINNIIEPDTDEKTHDKIVAVTDQLVNQTNITDDARTKIARRGFELLFANTPHFEHTANDVAQMVEDINTMLDKYGESPSAWKQVYALAECAAYEKEFHRGYVRVEKEDLLEAWYLSGFCQDKEVLLGGEWCKPKEV